MVYSYIINQLHSLFLFNLFSYHSPEGAPSGAMTMETTLAALTVVAGAMMLV